MIVGKEDDHAISTTKPPDPPAHLNHFAREFVARIVPFLRYGITWS